MSRTQELEKIKALIEKHYSEADCGLFDCRNLVGDTMMANGLLWIFVTVGHILKCLEQRKMNLIV